MKMGKDFKILLLKIVIKNFLPLPKYCPAVGYCNYSRCCARMHTLYYLVSMFSSYILVYEVGSAEK